VVALERYEVAVACICGLQCLAVLRYDEVVTFCVSE
jgi:hypothetical protein